MVDAHTNINICTQSVSIPILNIQKKVQSFPWLYFDENSTDDDCIEINYLQAFFKGVNTDDIDYRKLDIEEFLKQNQKENPLKLSQTTMSLAQRLNKFGHVGLMPTTSTSSKNNKIKCKIGHAKVNDNEYDYQDPFIDDSDMKNGEDSAQLIGLVRSTKDDFRSIKGDIKNYLSHIFYKTRKEEVKYEISQTVQEILEENEKDTKKTKNRREKRKLNSSLNNEQIKKRIKKTNDIGKKDEDPEDKAKPEKPFKISVKGRENKQKIPIKKRKIVTSSQNPLSNLESSNFEFMSQKIPESSIIENKVKTRSRGTSIASNTNLNSPGDKKKRKSWSQTKRIASRDRDCDTQTPVISGKRIASSSSSKPSTSNNKGDGNRSKMNDETIWKNLRFFKGDSKKPQD